MSSPEPESDSGSQRPPNGVIAEPPPRPVTPVDLDVVASSQVTLPSTEGPVSPIDPSASFKTELNDDRLSPSAIIPSSLTPPPSSQVPTAAGNAAGGAPSITDFLDAQRSGILSPPVTGLTTGKRAGVAVGPEYSPPSPSQVIEASGSELRSMLQTCIAEHGRLKMETAHHKLQYSLLAIQASEDAKRAAVEQDMVRREIEALKTAEHLRQAQRDLNTATNPWQDKYAELRALYDDVLDENQSLFKRLKAAKKVIQQKDTEIVALSEDKEQLLDRVSENRDHFNVMCSPGGLFYGILTPKTQAVSSPVQHRATPRQTPRAATNHHRAGADREPNMAVLLQVVNQENNSAPSTPTLANRAAPHRASSKHTRNVQSMSSLPTTPSRGPRGEYAALLPSVDLVPQTEPPRRHGGSGGGGGARHAHQTFVPETPPVRRGGDDDDDEPGNGRRSRESTISVEENSQINSKALLQFVAAAATRVSQEQQAQHAQHQHAHPQQQHASHSRSHSQPHLHSFAHSSGSHRPHPRDEVGEEIYESQASQAASEMLRRDPRESFEVASSAGVSRDVTPTPSSVPAAAAEKSARLQAQIFNLSGRGGGPHASPEKRKFSGASGHDAHDLDASPPNKRLNSPPKKLKLASLRDNRVGLGIQYGRDN